MPPNPKAKNDLQKLAMNEGKPKVGMIEKDGPLVDSPVAIDLGESLQGGSAQDVRVSHSP